MKSNIFTLVAASMLAIPALSAPIEIRGKEYWYENLAASAYTRCYWKKTHEHMKLAECGNVDKVPDGSPVTGPYVGNYTSSSSIEEAQVPEFYAGHAEAYTSSSTIHLALTKKHGPQWMSCKTAPQGSHYFGGHNSFCKTTLAWSDIAPGSRIMGLGIKNTTEVPELPPNLGGEDLTFWDGAETPGEINGKPTQTAQGPFKPLKHDDNEKKRDAQGGMLMEEVVIPEWDEEKYGHPDDTDKNTDKKREAQGGMLMEEVVIPEWDEEKYSHPKDYD